MKKPIKIALIVFGWTLMGALVYKTGVEQLYHSIVSVKIPYIVGGIAIMLCSQIVRAWRWYVLFNRRISLRETVIIYFANISYAAFSPLRIADLSIAPLLQKKWNINIVTTTKALFTEKVIDLSALVLCAIPGVVILGKKIVGFDAGSLMWIGIGGGLILCGVIFVMRNSLQKRLMVSSVKGVLVLWVASLCALMIELFAGYILVSGFFDLRLFDYVVLKPVSIVSGIMSMIPAGIGVESYSLTHFFTKIGYDSGIVGAGIISVRVVTMLVIMLVGQFVLYFLFPKEVKAHKKSVL